MKQYFSSAKSFVFAHKFWSAALALAVLGGGYWAYSSTASSGGETRYVLGSTATGTIIATISASGQVSATDQIDIKPKVSGTITWVGIKAGATVYAGQALMSIDSSDAEQSILEAQKSLEADKLQYQKDSAEAPIDYQNDLDTLEDAKGTLADDYNTLYNDLSDAYLDLPNAMTGANNALYGFDFDSTKQVWNMSVLVNLFSSQNMATALSWQTRAIDDYTDARAKYDAASEAFKLISRSSGSAALEKMLAQSIDAATAVAQALQSELNFLGAISDLAQQYNAKLPSSFSTLQSNTRTYLSTANSNLTVLLNDKKTLENDKQAIKTAEQNIELSKVGNTADGSNPISLQISKNNIEKQEASLAKMQADLADYTVRASFAGTLSSVSAKVGDTAGSAAVASLITRTQIASLSLNEVDAAKISLGQKATLTFDAVEDLSLTGAVAEIDSVGAVSQGVVSYTVKIAFDSQDSRIKPGMTVNASIQTDVRQNVLTVPSSAVKTQNGQSYVLTFDPPLENESGSASVTASVEPIKTPVETGISDDTNIEILSGLTPGQQIVVRTTTATATASAAGGASTKTATGAVVGGGPGGGAMPF